MTTLALERGEDGDVAVIGSKAAGLRRLPTSWVPPFVVIPTQEADRLIARLTSEANRELMQALDATASAMRQAGDSAIVRSSAAPETLEDRGRFDSMVCNSESSAILDAARSIATRARELGQSEVAIIVQRHVRAQLMGHLSNERRLASRKRDWVVEAVDVPDGNWQRIGFRSRRAEAPDAPLDARTLDQVHDRLREVAAQLMTTHTRYHCEWVWDGWRLYIVQADEAVEIRGASPGTARIAWTPFDHASEGLRAFIPSADATRAWPKVECLRAFERASLPAAELALLENPDILSALANGTIPRDLDADLRVLARNLMVVRTDRLPTQSEDEVMLPRTDATSDLAEVRGFLVRTANEMVSHGVGVEEFAFLVHTFIPARASAWSLASEDSPQVIVDATWGLPDGLMWYSHDTFEVDGSGGGRIRRRVRCKTDYVDYDQSGQFVRRTAGLPWDWKPALTDDEIRWIARATKMLATTEGRSIEVMFFVGVDPASGYSAILPWFTATSIVGLPLEREETYFFAKKEVIGSREDLAALSRRLGPNARPIISLRPGVEAVRDREFVAALITFAKSHRATVELEGSLLSHVYYLLKQAGVGVRPVDAFPLRERRETFGKLVRDLVPLRITSRGEQALVYEAPRAELIDLLKRKALEEAYELRDTSDTPEAIEELADLYEVIETLARLSGTSVDEVALRAAEKRSERGGFEQGLVLLETRTPPISAAFQPPATLFERVSDKGPVAGSEGAEAFRQAQAAEGQPEAVGDRLTLPLVPPMAGRSAIVLETDVFSASIAYRGKNILVVIGPSSRATSLHGEQLSLLADERRAV